MVAVGRHLAAGCDDWVEVIMPDTRISLQLRDMGCTGLETESVAMVSLCLVLHELPKAATLQVLREAHRILSPGGVLAIMEMDPEAPGCACFIPSSLSFDFTSYHTPSRRK